MENPIKMDDLGVPLFLETSILVNILQMIYRWCSGTTSNFSSSTSTCFSVCMPFPPGMKFLCIPRLITGIAVQTCCLQLQYHYMYIVEIPL